MPDNMFIINNQSGFAGLVAIRMENQGTDDQSALLGFNLYKSQAVGGDRDKDHASALSELKKLLHSNSCPNSEIFLVDKKHSQISYEIRAKAPDIANLLRILEVAGHLSSTEKLNAKHALENGSTTIAGPLEKTEPLEQPKAVKNSGW